MSTYVLILHDAKDSSQAGRAELQECLRSTLRMGDDKAKEVLSSLPAILCQGLSQHDAARFSRVLEHLGAVVEVMEAPESGMELSSMLTFSPSTTAADGDPQPPAVVSTEASAPGIATPADVDEFSLELEPESEIETGRAGSLATLFGDSLVHEAATPPNPEQASMPVSLSVSTPEHVSEERAASAPSGEDPALYLDRAFAARVEGVTRSAAPVASELEPLSPPRPHAAVRRSRALPLAVLSGVVALALGFPLLAGRHQIEARVTIDVARLLAEQAAILGHNGDTQVEKEELRVWQGASDAAETHSFAELFVGASGAHGGRIRIARDQPPRLTVEQLASGAPAPIWISRIEGLLTRPDSAAELPIEAPAGSDVLRGALRAYLGDTKGNDRIVLRGTVVVLPPEVGSTMRRVTWDVRSTGASHDLAPPIVRRAKEKTGYEVVLRGTLEIRPSEGSPLPQEKRSPEAAAGK